MNLSNLQLLWLNTISFILMLGLNSVGAMGSLNGVTVSEVSAQYHTLLTPAGYAFSIWSLIYLLLIGFLGYQWFSYRAGEPEHSLEPAGIWFAVSNVFNTLWIIAWVSGAIGLAFLLILGLFISLFQLVLRLRLEIWDAPVRIILFVWWPICIYIGWVTLATGLNLSAWLKAVFETPPFFSGEFWAIVALAALTSIYLLWTQLRNMREASLVAIWGMVAIAVNQWQDSRIVSIFALIGCVVLLARATQHALSNRATLPQNKLKRGEF